ncbi:carbohydrate kinase family protein [Streptomyces spongiicola]|nr:carbohydrate kinase family protein [Streptomyces spongiicola]
MSAPLTISHTGSSPLGEDGYRTGLEWNTNSRARARAAEVIAGNRAERTEVVLDAHLRASDERLRSRPDEQMLWDWECTYFEADPDDENGGGTVLLGVAWYDRAFFDDRRGAWFGAMHTRIYQEIGVPFEHVTVEHWLALDAAEWKPEAPAAQPWTLRPPRPSPDLDVLAQADRLPAEHEKPPGGQCAVLPGGAASNTAVGLVRQGCSVQLVSAVGDDTAGAVCLETLDASGVGTSLVRVQAGARTSMAVVFSSGGAKRMLTFAGADRSLAFDAVTEQDFRTADHLHVVGEPTPALGRVVRLAHRAGRSVSVEWNGRDMSPLARGAALNFMNADEAARLPHAREAPSAVPSGAAAGTAQRIAQLVSGDVIVTLGADGAVWATAEGGLIHEPTVPVVPLDRTGGGDAFDAGVIAGWLAGEPPGVCMRRGLDAALHVITKLGAQP